MWESSINRPLQVEHRDMAWLTFGRISCGLHESLVWISIQIMKTAVWRTKKFQFFLHFEDLFLRFVVFTKSKHNRSEGCWYSTPSGFMRVTFSIPDWVLDPQQLLKKLLSKLNAIGIQMCLSSNASLLHTTICRCTDQVAVFFWVCVCNDHFDEICHDEV